jgi:hypothetical protein
MSSKSQKEEDAVPDEVYVPVNYDDTEEIDLSEWHLGS